MRKELYVAVFISGMSSLAIEMAASRLLGNVFGTSNLVWASIIGLILIYIAVGNFVGGRWADKNPSINLFYRILLWAGFSASLIPLISRPILRLAADGFDQLRMGALAGSFVVVLIILCVPIILMGCISPFAIKLAIQDTKTAGNVSGRIYGISTFGSFLGTFLPVLILIPLIGTYRTFLSIGGILLLFALWGIQRHQGWKITLKFAWTILIVVALWIWGLSGTDKNTTGMIYETESGYNYIQVLDQNDYHLLRLNEGQGIHSVYHPEYLNYSGPWQQVLVAPFFNTPPYTMDQVKRIAIIGLAGGTTARQATAVYGDIPIDGYEIDPKIVEVGKEYFGMDMPNLNVIVQDGRWGLSKSPYQYQIISIDAYRPPYIPAHMTSQEFFEVVFDHLAEDGVMVINVGRAPNDRRLIDALSTTILTVFPTIHVMDVPNSFNSIIFATRQPTDQNNLIENINHLAQQDPPPHDLLQNATATAYLNMQPAPQSTIVFTDDKAPIEWITNNMVLSFLFQENLETN
ncbi:MAG: fused MFS/spermidine synthase [Anaerolineaceae bacterium]|nr:fused MFS/spermidine synthase [Anaerolineaceae bacterium]